ncbi:MAG TPA: hypothetical protein VF559_04260 [Caulobacteraceae bacterium]|jgi:hypothetical protein
MSVAYDTLKIARRLADAGLEPKVAEGVSGTLAEALALRDDAFVTKSDLHAAEHRVEAKMQSLHSDLLKWVIGSQIAIASILFAAIKLL